MRRWEALKYPINRRSPQDVYSVETYPFKFNGNR